MSSVFCEMNINAQHFLEKMNEKTKHEKTSISAQKKEKWQENRINTTMKTYTIYEVKNGKTMFNNI